MIKKFFIPFLILLVLSSLCHADLSDNMIGCLSFDENSGTVAINYANLLENGTIKNTPTLNQGCKQGKCYKYVGASLQTVNITNLINDTLLNNGLSICFWENYTSTSANGYGYQLTDDANNYYLGSAYVQATNEIHNNVQNSGGFGQYKITGMTKNAWHHVCIVLATNGSIEMTYLDGVAQAGVEKVGTFTGITNGQIGCAITAGTFNTCWSGLIDEFKIWNIPITQTEITADYNSSVGVSCLTLFGGTPPPPIPTLTLSNLNLSSGNYTSNFNFQFNGVVTDTTDNNFNCSLYLNNTINQTLLLINISEIQTFNLTYGLQQVGYNINVTCLNPVISDDFIVNDVFIDIVPPEIVISTEFTNGTTYYDNTNLNIKINYTDNNLFSIATNITDELNNLEFDFFIDNLDVTFFMINISNSTQKLGAGNYTISTIAWDSHTSFNLKKEVIRVNSKTLNYGGIEIYSDKDLDYIKNYDKVKSVMKGKSKLCYKTTDEFISIQDSEYPNHYIDIKNKVWIDEYSFTFDKIKDKNGKIKELCFTSNKDDIYISSSIGDMNFKYVAWEFSVISAPDETALAVYSLNSTLAILGENITYLGGDLQMLGIIIGFIIFLVLGILTIYKFLISISGLFSLLISFYFMSVIGTVTNASKILFYKGALFMMLFLGIGLLLLGIGWQIIYNISQFRISYEKENKLKYPKY